MNFLLVDPAELDAAATVVLRDRRAAHLRTVLQVEPGQRLRAGLLDGPRGEAEVLAVDADAVRVRLDCREPAPGAADALLLAVPRPKVLLRMLAHAAAFGVGRIVLFRSWRVEKSHLGSTAMQPAAWREALWLGLEQAGRTRLPTVQFCPLFRPMVEDTLPTLPLPALRFCAHPGAATATAALELPAAAPFALALGPDGGFLPYEVDQLAARGFLPVHCGPHPLRTEAALAALWGQLDLLRTRGSLPR